MISYGDFEFAIKRWKARADGAAEPVPESGQQAVSGAVEAPAGSRSHMAGKPADSDSDAVDDNQRGTPSGSILIDEALLDGSGQVTP